MGVITEYSKTPQAIRDAHNMLGLLTEGFRLYPHPDESRDPDPSEWGKFLMKYPQYITSNTLYDFTAEVFASSRKSVEGLSLEQQNLAASIIAVTFSEAELKSIANS